MTPLEFGKVAALHKIGISLSPLMKLIGKGALTGGAVGATTGGVSGAMAAPEGQRGSGFLRGMLAGGGIGALGGGLAGGFAGRGATQLQQKAMGRVTSPSQWMTNQPHVEKLLQNPEVMRRTALGGAGALAGGVGGGVVGGIAAAPEEKHWYSGLLGG